MSRWNSQAVGLAICIFLFLGLGYLIVKPQAPDYPPYLSFSADLDGNQAFSLLLQEKQQPVKEWRQSWRFLPQKNNQALVVVQPFLDIYEGEEEALLAWVEQGNDLIFFGDEHSVDWLNTATKSVEDYTKSLSSIQAPKLSEEPLTGQVKTSLRFTGVSDDDILLHDDLGVIAYQSSCGKGRVTIFLTPQWLTNEEILKHSHFAMLWPYFQKNWSAVWIDEYHHGYQEKSGLLALYPDWLIVALLQLAMALFLWLWWKGKRFGPVDIPRDWLVRRGDETLLAVASWYERRKLNQAAVLHQEKYLRQLIRERWGLTTYASDQDIVTTAQAKWDAQKVEALNSLFGHLEEVKSNERYTVGQLLEDSRKLDGFIHLLEKE